MDFSIQFEFQTQKEAVCITDGLLDENKSIKHQIWKYPMVISHCVSH